LVWEDEFAGEALDLAAWTPAVQGLNWNEEDQAYVEANVAVAGGNLVLTARKEHWEGLARRVDRPADARITREYTSGEANSKRSWTYGRFEMRARMAGTPGVLSALWMTPQDGGWPPEIDVAEVLGSHLSSVTFTNHYGTQQDHRRNAENFDAGTDLSSDFHVYAVEWEPHELRWYVDGELRFASRVGVPGEPFLLRISLPVGPEWEGDPSPGSVFPQTLLVDWVRVYQ
jgi:beta-glucanase (GH16 family)